MSVAQEKQAQNWEPAGNYSTEESRRSSIVPEHDDTGLKLIANFVCDTIRVMGLKQLDLQTKLLDEGRHNTARHRRGRR